MDNEFLANNLLVYITKDVINLFRKRSIIDKIAFLKNLLPNFSKYSYCQVLSFVVVLS